MTSRRSERRRTGARRPLAPRPAVTRAADETPMAVSRPARLVEREAPYLINELKRVAIVTATCVGLLALLTVVDRMR